MKRRNFLGACLAVIAAPLAALVPQFKQQDPRIFYATEKIKFGEKSKESPIVGKDSVGFTYNFGDMDPEELIAKMKQVMLAAKDNGWVSDHTTLGTFNYNDIYISPEGMADIRNWGVEEIKYV
jgi:hypothetical protein